MDKVYPATAFFSVILHSIDSASQEITGRPECDVSSVLMAQTAPGLRGEDGEDVFVLLPALQTTKRSHFKMGVFISVVMDR